MSVKEQNFTVPANGKVVNYDGWYISCDEEDCDNSVILAAQVIPPEYINDLQYKNGTFMVPWNDAEDENEVAEFMNYESNWRINKKGKVKCPEHSTLIREEAVKKTKELFDGLKENVDWFKEMVDDNTARLSDNKEKIILSENGYIQEIIPIKGNKKICIFTSIEGIDISSSDYFESNSFSEIGDMLCEPMDD